MPSLASLRDYLRARAAWVWNEQNHAFKRGLALQEETLTEMLLLRMAKDHAKHGLIVKLFNKAQESRNGADWEWHIVTTSCCLSLRIQAKRLYHRKKSSGYGGLDPTSPQTDKLISKAAASSCIPIFVFFNHDHGLKSRMFESGGEAPYRGRSYWGCSVASAERVKACATNQVSGLRPVLAPWHRLITPRGTCAVPAVFGSPSDGFRIQPTERNRRVLEEIENTDFMERFTEEEELAGVATMDFTEFRGA